MTPRELQGQRYECNACRNYGVIAVDADNVVACRSCRGNGARNKSHAAEAKL